MKRWLALLLVISGSLLATRASGQEVSNMEKLTVTSAAFAEGGAIAAKYTCDGVNVNPPLTIVATTAGTRSLALIMDDPDASAAMSAATSNRRLLI